MKKNKQILGIQLEDFANSLGHIDENKLFNLLYPSSKALRPKSDLKPFAQANTSCQQSMARVTGIFTIRDKIERIKSKDRLLYFIAHLQLIGGLRISEVLTLSPDDITFTGHIHIKSLKGSANAIIYAGNAADFLINCKQNCVKPFSLYSRFYVYRQYKKYGISFQSSQSSKSSVTHAIRHINTKAQLKESFSGESIQNFMRHKSKSNTEKYGKD